MRLTFRWYGPDDPVPLAYIRQIPGVTGVVSSLHDVAPGVAWTRDAVEALRTTVEGHGLALSVIESVPVHEAIKLGRPERDGFIDAYCESLAAIGAAGVPVVCYNFMPVFDWTRTDLALRLDDGSTTLAFDPGDAARTDLSRGAAGLPGWHAAYAPDELAALFAAYAGVDAERMWAHLAYFLERVVPAAEAAGVKMALHPDDPPWPIFGLPRIATSAAALVRVTELANSPANGITFCTGSLGADPTVDLPALVRRLGSRLHFAHLRDVAVTGPRRFHETAHGEGDVDLPAVVAALAEIGFDGPARPDHGRMIWGEGDPPGGDAPEGETPNARPGYGLYDRALGAAYLRGLWDATVRVRAPSETESASL